MKIISETKLDQVIYIFYSLRIYLIHKISNFKCIRQLPTIFYILTLLAYTKKQKWRPCFGHRLEAVHIPNICVRYSVLHDQDGSCLGCPSYISSEYYCYLQCKQCNNWRRCKCPAHCKRHNGRHYHTGYNHYRN